jgi:hypothetical protein
MTPANPFLSAMSTIPKPSRRWYQFTISGILWATLWMAICFGALASYGWYEFESPLPVLVVVVVAGLCPFIAAGVLFGRPLTGLVTGIVLVGAYAAFTAIMLL